MNDSTLRPRVSTGDHIQGRSDAPVTLLEYGDYQCPYCREAFLVIKRLRRSVGTDLRFVFRNFPIAQAHPYALIAAEAAEAASLQGKFWEMHDLLYENQSRLMPDILALWAEDIGLDLNQFAKAVRSRPVAKRIEDDYSSGLESGVEGTPSFFINGVRYEGEDDHDSLLAALRDAASKEGKK